MNKDFEPSGEYLNWLLEYVSVDHDGTIADSRTSVTKEFNKRHGTIHKVTDLNYWNAVYDWCKELKMSDEEAKNENNDLWYTPDTIFKARPTPGAIELLNKLHERGSNFIINSSRLPELRDSTVDWYKKYAPFVKPEQIHVAMPGFDGLITKVNRINGHFSPRFRLHVEDVCEHAKLVLDHTNAYIVLLSNQEFDHPAHGRYMQIKGKNGGMPDFWPINHLLFG